MKYKILYIAIIVSVFFVSCKKFLDTEPASAFTDTYVFSHIEDAQKMVNAIYANFNTDAFTSRMSNNFNGNTDIECGSISTSAPDNSRRDIWSFQATPANADLQTVWNNAYLAINRANECIEGIRNSSLYKDSTNTNFTAMKQLLGESLTLRAYWYHCLVNYWGDVPFNTTPTKHGDNFYQPRVGRDTILTHVINDLLDIKDSMEWSTATTYGIEQVNREFTLGMIARLALTRGGYWLYPDMTMKRKADYLDYYKIANTACKELMSLQPHTLNSSFGAVFYNECQGIVSSSSDDVLYEVAFAPGYGDVGWCNGIAVVTGSHAYGAGSSYLCFPPSYFYSFDTTDLRLPITCSLVSYDASLAQVPVGTGGISPGKWNRLWLSTPGGASSSKGTGINWPLMRYSDVLLMLAETENEINNGPTSEAKAALRKVRQRAFSETEWQTKVEDYITSVSTSKEAFFNAIVNERAWEFGGECLRKFDLIRWNLYGKKVAETKALLTQYGIDTYTPANKGTYSKLPDYLYYKTSKDSSIYIDNTIYNTNATVTIQFLNKFFYPSPTPTVKDATTGLPKTGYTRVSWLRGLYNSTSKGPADYILRTWRGYTDDTGVTPLRYILPVHNSIVTSSNGVVNNVGYGFNF
jgi:starch-binding outer membrane protein, SusD/RagB family